jgi:hypothetical protein
MVPNALTALRVRMDASCGWAVTPVNEDTTSRAAPRTDFHAVRLML